MKEYEEYPGIPAPKERQKCEVSNTVRRTITFPLCALRASMGRPLSAHRTRQKLAGEGMRTGLEAERVLLSLEFATKKGRVVGVGTERQWSLFSLRFYYCSCVDGVLVSKGSLWGLASYLCSRKPTGCEDFFCAPTHWVKVCWHILSSQSGVLATATAALIAVEQKQSSSVQGLGGQLKMLAKNR